MVPAWKYDSVYKTAEEEELGSNYGHRGTPTKIRFMERQITRLKVS